MGLGLNRVRVRVRPVTSGGGGGALCLLGLRLGDLVELEEGGEGEVVDAALVRVRVLGLGLEAKGM